MVCVCVCSKVFTTSKDNNKHFARFESLECYDIMQWGKQK